jgi:hypothetical protein
VEVTRVLAPDELKRRRRLRTWRRATVAAALLAAALAVSSLVLPFRFGDVL